MDVRKTISKSDNKMINLALRRLQYDLRLFDTLMPTPHYEEHPSPCSLATTTIHRPVGCHKLFLTLEAFDGALLDSGVAGVKHITGWKSEQMSHILLVASFNWTVPRFMDLEFIGLLRLFQSWKLGLLQVLGGTNFLWWL